MGDVQAGSPREEFVERGFTAVREAVPPPELAEIRAELEALIDDYYQGRRAGTDFWSYPVPDRGEPILYRIHNLDQQPGCPAVRRLMYNRVLDDIATECLNQPAHPTVRAAVIKLPSVGAPVPWHRDRWHAEVPPGQALNLSLYLHNSTTDNGCLQVVPATQALGPEIDPDEWRRSHDVLDVTARAGDITAHDVRIVHGSGPNAHDDLCVRIVMEFRAESLPALSLLQAQ